MTTEVTSLSRVDILNMEELHDQLDNIFRSPLLLCAQNSILLFITSQIVKLHNPPSSHQSVLFKFEQIVSTTKSLR